MTQIDLRRKDLEYENLILERIIKLSFILDNKGSFNSNNDRVFRSMLQDELTQARQILQNRSEARKKSAIEESINAGIDKFIND